MLQKTTAALVLVLLIGLLPVIAYADNFLSQCPGSQPLSGLLLTHSGCVDGSNLFSDFWAVSIGSSAETNLSTVDVAFTSSATGESDVEFTGFRLYGGNTGAWQLEIISYVLSSLGGAPINHLTLDAGSLHQTDTGGFAVVLELAFSSNYDLHFMWALPGGSSKITFDNPVDRLRVFDVVELYAPPHDTVTLDSFSDPISSTAEPGTIVMLGTALLALARMRTRRNNFGTKFES